MAVYPVDDPQILAPLAQGLLPQSRVFVLTQPRALVVEATESQHQQLAALLKALAEVGGPARPGDDPHADEHAAGPGGLPPQEAAASPLPGRAAPVPPQDGPRPEPKPEPDPRKQDAPQEQEAVLLFAAPDAGASLAQALLLRFKEAKVTYLEALKVVMVQLPRALAAEAQDFVRQLEAARPAVLPSPAPAAPVERALPLGYAKAKGVLELVAKLLPESKEVLLAADERTNTVLLRGPAAAVDAIERLVGELDRPVPQVDLQVRVEQITSGQGEDVRVALEAALGPFTLKADPGSGAAGLGMEVGAGSLLKLNATLKALQSAGKSRSLIDSRFTVSSGESVNLLSGGSLLIPLSSSGSNGGTAGLQSVEFGLELKLTPAVIPGGKIQLAVSINLGSAPSSGPNNATVIPKQQLTSNVLLTSGHSAVLGGVISSTEQESRSGVPLLMDLPLIGGLFGQTSKSVSQNHLLIVVTAVSRMPEPA
ncbi:secretin N-terminal domain-containing protein, partial [Calidithermus terrae]|uniref:secretin N-terminal domain-containing protein n=1 Tax=Calidithermus terrae TaxID=1408545 RepID=UPI0023AAA722